MTLGALIGLVGGAIGELFVGIFEGTVLLEQIGIEALIWGVSLSLAAGAAYLPSHWMSRGVAGGVTYGLVRGGLTVAFSLSEAEWAMVLGNEVSGGILGGLILAYLWRPAKEKEEF